MRYKCIHILIISLSGLLLFIAQVRAEGLYMHLSDSIKPKRSNIEHKDTARIENLPDEYQTLKNRTSKNKFSKKIFSWMIREPISPNKLNEERLMVREFRPYAGKVIRQINIIVLDPFGTNVHNPDFKRRRKDYDLLNDSHSNTKKYVIRKYLQFKPGDEVQPALIAESEALLRSTGYINDARISIIPVEGLELVDIDVVVRDKWTFAVELHKLTGSALNLEIQEKNILGTGSRVGVYFNYSTKYKQKFGFGGNYSFQNIGKTFIDFEIDYEDKIKSHEFEVSLERKLQPKINYFGEVSFWRNIKRTQYQGWDSIMPDHEKRFSASFGRAFTLASRNSVKRIVLGLRYKHQAPKYKDQDYKNYIADILLPYKYTPNNIWLMQVSLYKNAFIREYMINNFGTTEDIAQGYNFSLQMGYSKFDKIPDGLYNSFSASYGTSKLLKGYIYGSSAISSFFSDQKPFESVLKFDGLYYSPLTRILDGRLRQFASISYSKLLTPDRYFSDRIYMGKYTNLPMRRYKKMTSGVEQFLFKTETDLFSKYEVLGVRSVFYAFLDVCWITPDKNLFRNENLTWGVGVGIRLRNDLFILKALDLKIGYYPRMNQGGFSNFFRSKSSPQRFSPNFIPSYPEEIVFE